jgi:hypothetical protein
VSKAMNCVSKSIMPPRYGKPPPQVKSRATAETFAGFDIVKPPPKYYLPAGQTMAFGVVLE